MKFMKGVSGNTADFPMNIMASHFNFGERAKGVRGLAMSEEPRREGAARPAHTVRPLREEFWQLLWWPSAKSIKTEQAMESNFRIPSGALLRS
jgi:hypothetical protein